MSERRIRPLVPSHRKVFRRKTFRRVASVPERNCSAIRWNRKIFRRSQAFRRSAKALLLANKTYLIADDHSVVREGLVSLIEDKADMRVVGEASNGREAVELWKKHRPDVTLLDLRMRELDGVSAIKAIRADDENARIIVLTTFDGDEDIYRAIQAGAKGYLLKDVPREALMDCVRRVHRGDTCVPVNLAAKLAQLSAAKR
jgi:DNA-binding NarL/FixJ family response regulator